MKATSTLLDGSTLTVIARIEDVIVTNRVTKLIVSILEAASVTEKLQKVDIVVPSGLGQLYKKAASLGKNDEIVVSGKFSDVSLSTNTVGSIATTKIGVLARRTIHRDTLEKTISSF